MNTLYLVVVALTALPIVVGGLMGLKRGLNRSVLRLIIVVASVVVAWVLREKLIDAIMTADISAISGSAESGQTIPAMIESSLGEQANLAKLIIPIVEILVGIIAFLLSFIVLKFVSLIVFWILSIFVRPGAKKRRLFGALVGVAQGLVVAYFICVPLNGLIGTVDTLSKIEIPVETVAEAPASNAIAAMSDSEDEYDGEYDGENEDGETNGSSASSSNPLKDICESLGITEYKASGISGLYDAVSLNVYDALTTVKDENGKNVTLGVQVDAIVAAVKVANEAQKLVDIDLSAGLTDENVGKLKETLNEIENIKNEMTPEALESLTEMITVAVDSFIGEESGIDFSGLDLNEVNFSAAGEAIEEASNLQKVLEDENATEEQIQEQVEKVIEKVADSNLATAMADMDLGFSDLIGDEETKDSVNQTIDDLTEGGTIDEQTAEALKKILGVGDYANIGDEGNLSGDDSSDKNSSSQSSSNSGNQQSSTNEDIERIIKEREQSVEAIRSEIASLEEEKAELEEKKKSADETTKAKYDKQIKMIEERIDERETALESEEKILEQLKDSH